MAQKHLHELLKEDQEPFYISNRHFHQIKKSQKQINQTPTSKFCKNTCFSSFHDSPELRKSPLYLPSPGPAKCPENGKFVLHVPRRTATLLLDAAMRIQKQKNSSSKPKNGIKKVKFGVFGSILKRLKDRNKPSWSYPFPNSVHSESFSASDCSFYEGRNGTLAEILWSDSFLDPMHSGPFPNSMHSESISASDCCFSKDRNGTLAEILWSDSFLDPMHSDPFPNSVHRESVSASDRSFFKDRNGTLAEILWSDSFLDPTMHDESLSTSSCRCSNKGVNNENNEEKSMDLENYSNNGDFGSCELSPFRFSLQRCPSSGDVMPEFTTPAPSPVCHKKEDKENNETIIALTSIDKVEEEEDEKDQCSPVSVLDPPFEEEEDDGHEGEEDEEEDSDLDCSYALVQRAQQQLLYKLRRFEKLAELDPIELEKLLLEEEEEEDDNGDRVEEEECQVSNLISEEKSNVKSLNYGEAVFGRECNRFDTSQELRSNNTIGMMVKSDFESKFDEWNNFHEQREETAIEFAFSIFGLLVEELEEELLHLAWS